MGDEVHAFGLDTQGDDGPVTIRTYLIRVGPVVAKVLAGGGGLTGGQVEAIATCGRRTHGGGRSTRARARHAHPPADAQTPAR